MAEQIVAIRLLEQGHQISFPENPNEPGHDLIVDGMPFQVKCTSDLGTIEDRFAKFPDIQVIANAEMANPIQESAAEWSSKVYFVEGYDLETAHE